MAVLAIPFGLWLALTGFTGLVSKSLSNAAIEPTLFGAAVPVALLLRVLLGKRLPDRASAACIIGAVTVAAVCVCFAVPCLPE
jgi:hypothetical protein